MNKLSLAPDSFGFDIQFRDQLSSSIKMHCHDFHEMVYIFSGRGKHVTEQGKYDIGSGDLFIIPPGHEHAYEDREHLTGVNIMFDLKRLPYPTEQLMSDSCFRALFMPDDDISDSFRIHNKLKFTGDDQTKVEALIHGLLREYGQSNGARQVLLIALLTELFVEIIRFCAEGRYARSRDLVLLQGILQYMSDNCASQLSIPAVAKRFGLSQRNLDRLFLQSVQMPPVSYLLDLRLRSAAEKIRSGGSKITEVAYECGFNDSNYFAKLFRRKYGLSPRSFRKKNQ